MENIIVRGFRRLKSNPRSLFIHLFRMSIGKLLPDSTYLKLMNHIYMHKNLNLSNPQTFNEKIQWLKLYDRKPIYTTMVDKYEAKKYVASIIGEQYIIPTLGVYNDFDEIDLQNLPQKFVIKATHNSGGLVICRDKKTFNVEAARHLINTSLKNKYFWVGREWPYKNVKPRVIVEKYMENMGDDELTDYKWFCFDGNPEFLYISHGLAKHDTATIDFYDMNHHRMPFKRTDYKSSPVDAPKPGTYDEMVDIAKKLSKGIPFLRVDLYEINGRVYFSELTFSPCSGWMPFDPPEWDLKLGEYIKLPNITK